MQRGRQRKLTLDEAAFKVMEQAYMKVSDNGRLPANARQIMYAARPLIIELLGKFWKHSSSFTQKALPDFMAQNPERTKNWDVVFDARGHFVEPHTQHGFGLGTTEVRNYINSWQRCISDGIERIDLDLSCPTRGPANRYRIALFIEKEGFDPLLKHAGIAELYDAAIFSTKGMSVTNSRRLVEELSAVGVTILVLHDFDFAGLGILHTLCHDNRRYTFSARPKVIDLGLRLEDVEKMDLASEDFDFGRRKKDPRELLKVYGATPAECDFLVDTEGELWAGRRVELNSMTSQQFLDFLATKFDAAGVKKVVPGAETLAAAYKRAKRLQLLLETIDTAMDGIADFPA